MSSSNEMRLLQKFLDKSARIYVAVEPRIEWLQMVETTVQLLLKAKEKKLLLDTSLGFAEFAIRTAFTTQTRVVKFDLSRATLKAAKYKAGKMGLQKRIDFVLGSPDFLPFKNSCFNAIAIFYSLHHLYLAVVEKLLNESNRVLKKKGRLVAVEDWAYEPRNEFQFLMLELRKTLLETELKPPYRTYYNYISSIEQAKLRVFSTEIYAKQMQLPSLDMLENKKALKLVEKAMNTPVEERILDTTVIAASKD